MKFSTGKNINCFYDLGSRWNSRRHTRKGEGSLRTLDDRAKALPHNLT